MRHVINVTRILTDPRIVVPVIRSLCGPKSRNDNLHAMGVSSRIAGIRRRLAAAEFVRRWLRRERFIRHRGRWVINSLHPPFPSQAFERTFRNFCDAGHVPQSANLAITARCPADCWQCSVKQRQSNHELSHSDWKSVIENLNDLGVGLVGFTGGEPTLREDLPDLVRLARDGGAAPILFTSGIGVTEKTICTLRKAGLWALGVSLDRADRDSVTRLCQHPDAYDAAIASLQSARQAGLYTFINAVVDNEAVDADEHTKLYKFAMRLKVQELRLIEPKPCGRLAGQHDSRFLGSEQTATLSRFHREKNRQGQGPKVCSFNEVESPELFGCVAGTLHLFIDPAGEVCPCDFTPLSFGNVNDEPLDLIWRRMSETIRQPRRNCLMKSNASLIQQELQKNGAPLPNRVSCHIMSQSEEEALPNYFQVVTKPFGYPSR